MVGSPKYQVFVSSTYEDLQDERDQVIRAVLEMGHIPVGMEMFSAADESQWKIIARHIEESDYYVVVVAHRLGSLTPEDISYTRKEYEYARSIGVPCLGFLIADGVAWPPEHVETGTGRTKALQEFKSLIREKPVDFWSNADDLHAKVSIALMKAFVATPREGWVRASSMSAPPEFTAELARLSAENAVLRKTLEEAEESATRKETDRLLEVVDVLFATMRTPHYRYANGRDWQDDVTVSLFDIFVWLGPEMVIECAVDELANNLAMWIRKDENRSWDIVALNQTKGLLADLMTLDLVQPSVVRHSVADTKEYWSLAPDGVKVLKMARRTRLGSEESPAPEDFDDAQDPKMGAASETPAAATDGEADVGTAGADA